MSLTIPAARSDADAVSDAVVDRSTSPDLAGRIRAAAREHGATHALTLLHAATLSGVLPAGPGGHVLVPESVAAAGSHYDTPQGPRPRRPGGGEELLARLPQPDGEALVALRVPGAGPGPEGGAAFADGLVALRLGLAERALREAADRLKNRTVQGTVMLHLPLVRALVADAACGLAEARALLSAPADQQGPTELRRAHRALDESGRTCLHLLGAAGFLTGGTGDLVRVSELLADTYAPPPPVPEGDRT
ncbi:acyl-CoA dehydrogenase family protein [Streptomyces griseorubiginosus]|uniref:acyl-CoA dehydrogenase family protein n=1 Tax=Streptomyces griseorubiginosus TaxID=67304 RepID=UPI003655997A